MAIRISTKIYKWVLKFNSGMNELYILGKEVWSSIKMYKFFHSICSVGKSC
jgi:hypothetical protein